MYSELIGGGVGVIVGLGDRKGVAESINGDLASSSSLSDIRSSRYHP